MDPSGAGREGADHAGLPRPCGGGNTHSHTPCAQTVGARPGRDLGAFGGVILALTATTGGSTRWRHDWYSSGSILTLARCREPLRTHSAMASLVKWLSMATVGMAAREAAASGPEGSSPWRRPHKARR